MEVMDIEAVETTEPADQQKAPSSASCGGSGAGASSPSAAQPRYSSPPTGTWLHAGYHLTTGTAGASTPNLPATLASLGWELGVFFLILFTMASFYTYYLLILVLDRLNKNGKRCHQFGEASKKLIGRRWTICMVTPLQFVVCFTTVVSFVLLGGQSLKAVCYAYSQPYSKITLPMYTAIFGFISTILSQLPTFHSLRHLNLVSFISSLAYALLVVIGSFLAHQSKDKPQASYTLLGSTQDKVMNAFNSFSILSTIYGNALLAETQATISNPIKQNMTKGLCLCYVATIATFFPVAFVGYWAFGNTSNSNIFLSMISTNGATYIPRWMFVLANLCMIMQLIAGSVLYSQPTFSVIEKKLVQMQHVKETVGKNALRFLLRTIFMMLATLLAAMLPFFGDINAIVGSIGYTPIVFIFPTIFYILVFKETCPSGGLITRLFIIFVFVIIAMVGCFTSIHQLVKDERTYKLFANL